MHAAQGRSQKEISCFVDFEGFALNLDQFPDRPRVRFWTVKIHLGYVPVNTYKYANGVPYGGGSK